MKRKYFYKVVGKYGCNYKSCRIRVTPWRSELIYKQLQVVYKKNNWAFPKLKDAKLLVFKKLKDAEQFMINTGDGEDIIFKCEIKNPEKIKVLMGDIWSSNKEKVKTFWNTINAIDEDPSTPSTPEGTYGADAVKLIKEVKI